MINIRVLVENTSIDPKNIPGKHGLSLLIEAHGKRILYDFGPGDCLAKNCKNMAIPLETVDIAVLSHSHSDHGGGINTFLANNKKSSVFAMHSIRNDLFTQVIPLVRMPIGVKIDEKHQNRIKILTEPKEISHKVHVLNFLTYTNTLTNNNALFVRNRDNRTPDDFSHESILVIEDEDTLTVFNACSHHGVIATLQRVKELFPQKLIKYYVGGFHLCNPVTGKSEDSTTITKTAHEMLSWGTTFYTGHCTGQRPFSTMKSILGESLQALSTGIQLSLN